MSRLSRNFFGDFIHFRIWKTQHSCDIFNGVFRLHISKSDNVGNMVRTITAFGVFNHLTSSIHAEVNIEVGHRNTLWIDKSIKEEVISHWVNLSNSCCVSNQTARSRASSWPYRNIIFTSIVDIIPHNQEIFNITEFVDGVKLHFKSFFIFFWGFIIIVSCKAFPCQS